jgi:tRNA (mo5U34)-methyltransferase
MIDFAGLAEQLRGGPLESWAASLEDTLGDALTPDTHGDMARWLDALKSLPELDISSVELDHAVVRAGRDTDCAEATRQVLYQALTELRPWRKGPFDICGIRLDTEWRSDLKWDRLRHAISPLAGRTVLDVGCGSGYHCWRMAGAGAHTVIGIEPMPLYVLQFLALRRYLGEHGVWVLPLRLEQLPNGLHAFDTVFSMGVLYHRRSPIDHLRELRAALRAGGELVLETLVVEGDEHTVLLPGERYARMRNVWFIPSVAALRGWLERVGFREIAVVDVSATTVAEQRTTEWMPFESLAAALDPTDESRTIEGYPAPLRAIVRATG